MMGLIYLCFISGSVQSICRATRTTWRGGSIGNTRLVVVRLLDIPRGFTYGKVGLHIVSGMGPDP